MDHQPNTGWIWPAPKPTKRKAECYDSWEERAFAEDAAGVLGSSGCVWPPRSYSCTFCRREFRSAQALGGHMNVHRRDRARLKQQPNTPQSPPTQTLIPNPTSPKPDLNYKKCPSTFLYGTNANPNYAKPNIVEAVNSKCLNSELSISLNLVVRRNIHGEEASSCFKRRKIVSQPLILLSSERSEVNHKTEINTASKEVLSQEIDLELRLGG